MNNVTGVTRQPTQSVLNGDGLNVTKFLERSVRSQRALTHVITHTFIYLGSCSGLRWILFGLPRRIPRFRMREWEYCNLNSGVRGNSHYY